MTAQPPGTPEDPQAAQARAFFDEIDDDVMDNIRDGEEHVLESLAKAEAALPAGRYRDEVATMRTELQALLEETARRG